MRGVAFDNYVALGKNSKNTMGRKVHEKRQEKREQRREKENGRPHSLDTSGEENDSKNLIITDKQEGMSGRGRGGRRGGGGREK